jgi:hypothetical protein
MLVDVISRKNWAACLTNYLSKLKDVLAGRDLGDRHFMSPGDPAARFDLAAMHGLACFQNSACHDNVVIWM